MAVQRTYLDYNASAPLRPEARAAMLMALDCAGNPSSVHAEGRRARAIVEKAREQVAALVNAKPEEVVFTSGGTEANNWALGGAWETIVTPETEHASVIDAAKRSRARTVWMSVEHLKGWASPWYLTVMPDIDLDRAVLVSVQMANNETGVINDLQEQVFHCREQGRVFHTDAVQGLGKIPIDFEALGADFMSLSSHKIGGPKGTGALVIRTGEQLTPLIAGGGQERRRRAGTENVVGTAGFGAAAEAAARDLDDMDRITGLRDRLEAEVARITPEAVVVAQDSPRLPNTSCIALPGRKAETLVIALDLAGVAVSAGAACSSGKVGRSHVLDAMRLHENIATSAIRVSLGWNSTEGDVRAFLEAWRVVDTRRTLISALSRKPVN